MSHRRAEKDKLRAEREAAERARSDASARRRRMLVLGGILAAALVAVAVIVVVAGGGGSDDDGTTTSERTQSTTSPLDGIPQSGTSLGDPDAPVVLTEFADLQCPFCRDYSEEVFPELVDKYVKTGEMRLEIRLLRFIGPDSDRAARAAYAAGQSDKMWNFVDSFFSKQGQENSSYVTDDFLTEISQDAGVDPDEVLTAVNNDEFEDQLTANEEAANAAGIDSTPSFQVAKGDGAPRLVEVQELTLEAFEQALAPELSG